MNSLIKNYEESVREQALAAGYSEVDSERMAAQAVLDNVEVSHTGYAVAQAGNFVPTKLYSFTFNVQNIYADQAGDGGTVVDALLGTPTTDVTGQSFSEKPLRQFAQQINEQGIQGFIDDEDSPEAHAEFRQSGSRDDSKHKAVTDWVKAFFKDGNLWIKTKLKQGFEWVADKFKGVSLEAAFPESSVLKQGAKTHFLGDGFIKGFVFTNRPKNPRHRVFAPKTSV